MFARGVRARGQAHCGGWHLTTQAAATRAQEAAAHWLGPRYSARTAYFGKWRTYLRRSRVARHLNAGCAGCGCVVQVQWARDHGGRAGGRAGGRTGANVPRPKRHGVPVQASDTRSDAKPQAGLLLQPQGANAARERRTISSRRSGAPPCCPSPRPSPHRPPFPLGGNCHDARRQRQAHCESGPGFLRLQALCKRCV